MRETATNALAANPEFLVLTFLRVTFFVCVLVCVFVLLAMLLLLSLLQRPEDGGASSRDALRFLLLPLLIIVSYLGYRILSDASVCIEAFRQYRKTRNLPSRLR